MFDELHAAVGERAHRVLRPVRRCVVDDDHAVDELGDAGQRRPDQLLLVVGGNDDREGLAFQHYALAKRRATGLQTSAAMIPMISPIAPPTSIELRVLRAVVFVGTGRSTNCGFSTFSACESCCSVRRLLEQQLALLLDRVVHVPLEDELLER